MNSEIRIKSMERSYRHNEKNNLGPLTASKLEKNDGTMVTIVCITYNQEKFIGEALESFVNQKTNFKFKVFVGEDHGTDHTADIIKNYAKKYPDIIVPFIRQENMGAQRNLIDMCMKADSPYIAFCEGDDYWIDDYKLQKQVDYMEKHREICVCGTRTEIDAPEDWQFGKWYKKINGRFIIPDSNPDFSLNQELYSPAYFIKINFVHTSSFFFRWDYDCEIPEWYYKGFIGDAPILLLQLGIGKIALLKDVTSVYRINSGSVFFNKDVHENFLRTRLEYLRYLEGIRNYALKKYPDYPFGALDARIKKETLNYLKTIQHFACEERIIDLVENYPRATQMVLKELMISHGETERLVHSWGIKGYRLIANNWYYRNALRPYSCVVRNFSRCKGWLRFKFINLIKFITYWMYSFVPKKDNIWVFSGFNKNCYVDNTKYLYEWVISNHPEIKAYWLTKNNDIYTELDEAGKPVLKFRTWNCIKIMSQASVAFTDHFIMSDYDNVSGFNHKTKVVQLWHGVGLKSIGDLENTNVNGVVFSTDILPQSDDSFLTKALKKLKYIRHAYFRELFEEYFLLICPGMERVYQIADPWHIPRSHCFFAGHPRNIYLYKNRPDSQKRVIYAPTYRWRPTDESDMVNSMIDAFPLIEKSMQKVDGEFIIHLHPHTWRKYSYRINKALLGMERIKYYDNKADIYKFLGKCSVMISDYSSIAYDFVLLNRPIVFYCPDLENFMNSECKLNYDYQEYSPGVKTRTWKETMDAVIEYLYHPDKDSEWRDKVRKEFYNLSANDENNSERIVQEVKRRLHF